jgi:branched-chain amino acid transport system substrate-binding protein
VKKRKGRAKTWTSYSIVVLISLVTAVAVVGCGGGGSSSSSSSSSEPAETSSSGGESSSNASAESGSEASGEPVKVMTIVTLTSSSGSSIIYPETAESAKATEGWINANGGIGGRPIEDIICDDKSDPNQTVACARKAVEEHVVALIGDSTQFSDKAYPIIEKAGIAILGNIPITPPDGVSPYSFPTNAGSAVLIATAQLAANQPECKEIGLVTVENTAVPLIEAGMIGTLLAEGKESAYTVLLPEAAQDFSGEAAEVAEGGDCAMYFTIPRNAEVFIPQLRQATQQPLIVSGTAMTTEVIEKSGEDAEGILTTQYYPPYESEAMKPYREVVENYSDASSWDTTYYNGPNTWQSMLIFKEVAEKLKTIDAESFYDALKSDKNVSGQGITPNLDFTKSGEWAQVPSQKRIFNRAMIYDKVEGGKFVQIEGEFHDMTKLGGEAFAAFEEAAK